MNYNFRQQPARQKLRCEHISNFWAGSTLVQILLLICKSRNCSFTIYLQIYCDNELVKSSASSLANKRLLPVPLFSVSAI